jgi:hypothetical protein
MKVGCISSGSLTWLVVVLFAFDSEETGRSRCSHDDGFRFPSCYWNAIGKRASNRTICRQFPAAPMA